MSKVTLSTTSVPETLPVVVKTPFTVKDTDPDDARLETRRSSLVMGFVWRTEKARLRSGIATPLMRSGITNGAGGASGPVVHSVLDHDRKLMTARALVRRQSCCPSTVVPQYEPGMTLEDQRDASTEAVPASAQIAIGATTVRSFLIARNAQVIPPPLARPGRFMRSCAGAARPSKAPGRPRPEQ